MDGLHRIRQSPRQADQNALLNNRNQTTIPSLGGPKLVCLHAT
jgi:hypothetical protein